ncbi:MAG: hypothetical protein J5588_08100 [Bacteroidales bacterium]|nr:hypothetical protein [Bacteroidales bacterium]
MKRFLFIFIVFLPIVGFSQSMFELSGYGKYSRDIRSNVAYNAGAMFEWQPKSGVVGLNYSLRFGRNENNNFVFQCPISAFTAILAAAWLSEDSDLGVIGLFLCLIPEGVTYNVWLNDDVAIAPYINPLMIEFSQDNISPVIEAGAKMKVYMGSALFGSLDLSVQSPYDYKKIDPCVGLSLGVRF